MFSGPSGFPGGARRFSTGEIETHIIRMYYAPGEHNPPHFHAYYNEFSATFSIDSLELTLGELPRRQIRLVQAWAELHRDELQANWQMVTNGEEPCRIPPLQ